MKLEVRMNTLSNDIQNQVKAGRQTVEKSLGEIKEIDVRQLPPVAFLAAGLAVAAGAVGGGGGGCPRPPPRPPGQPPPDAPPPGGTRPPGGGRHPGRPSPS